MWLTEAFSHGKSVFYISMWEIFDYLEHELCNVSNTGIKPLPKWCTMLNLRIFLGLIPRHIHLKRLVNNYKSHDPEQTFFEKCWNFECMTRTYKRYFKPQYFTFQPALQNLIKSYGLYNIPKIIMICSNSKTTSLLLPFT